MISIIIPAFNAEKYLQQCLESVIKQTYSDFEAIIIDDGSMDSTPCIANEICSLDSRFRYARISNSGVSEARNYGINMAKGEYIAFLDSDDIISPQYLSILIERIEGCDLVVCDKTCFFDKQLPSFSIDNTTHFFSQGKDYSFIGDCSHSTVWGGLYKRELLSNLKFNKNIFVAEDSLFFAQTVLRANGIRHLKSAIYGYRVHSASTTGKKQYTEKEATELCAWKEICLLCDSIAYDSVLAKSAHIAMGYNAYKGLKLMGKKTKENKRLWEQCSHVMLTQESYVINSNQTRFNKYRYCFTAHYSRFGIALYRTGKALLNFFIPNN